MFTAMSMLDIYNNPHTYSSATPYMQINGISTFNGTLWRLGKQNICPYYTFVTLSGNVYFIVITYFVISVRFTFYLNRHLNHLISTIQSLYLKCICSPRCYVGNGTQCM